MKNKLIITILRVFFFTLLLCMFKNVMYSLISYLISYFDLYNSLVLAALMFMDDVGASSQSSLPPAEPPAPEPSALQQRENELILENVEQRKGALGEGQKVDEVRVAVEQDCGAQGPVDRFSLIQELKAETKGTQDCPATKSALNEIKDFQSHVQDGRGGGNHLDLTSDPKGQTPSLSEKK